MATWTCLGSNCGTVYAIGLSQCPRCHSTEFMETGAEVMPKITKHDGPSIHEDEPDLPEDEGGELPSVGMSSLESSESPNPSDWQQNSDPISTVQTTENPSQEDQGESSTADSADGDQTAEQPTARRRRR